MLERQREGISKAKAQGKYKGRKSIGLDLQQEVVRLVEIGMTKAKVAKELKIGEATVYRTLKNTNTDSAINEGLRPLHDSSGT